MIYNNPSICLDMVTTPINKYNNEYINAVDSTDGSPNCQ